VPCRCGGPVGCQDEIVRDWQAVFDEAFRTTAPDVRRGVWRSVYGDEYPEEVDPYSYVSRTELAQLQDALRVGAGATLGDIGCGQGGPGLWLAARTGANLVGVDISPVALTTAGRRAAALGLAGRVAYRQGSFAATGLPDSGLDAVVSIDALLFAPDKAAAVAELARVLRPGGRLAVTTWDYHRQPEGRPPQVDDHRPLLTAHGFTVLRYADTVDWRHRVTAVSDALVERADEVAAETGSDAAEVRAGSELMRRTIDAMLRRVLIVAEKSP
jgi:SAM-dependent methyltransferase